MIDTGTSNLGIGNELYRILRAANNDLFLEGELAQLTHNAFDNAVTVIKNSTDEEILINYPIGYDPHKQPILGESKYEKKIPRSI